MTGKRMLWMATALLCAALPARADTSMLVFRAEDVPEPLLWSTVQEAPEETTITLTFAGDCTLGGEPELRSGRNSFATAVRENGMDYPFAGLQALFASDDFTLVNLEGVLGGNVKERVKKEFNFLGDAAYTAILTEGSVECVNLANNHTQDFGAQGFAATLEALDQARLGYVDEQRLCILEKDGVRIGLTASLFTMNGRKQETLKAQMQLLRDLGCSVIVHSMHAGTEYADRISPSQKAIAAAAVEGGAALVVGHHPHVIQGVEVLGQTPVVYSLGNNSFGGNANPPDHDALLLRAVFRFRRGVPVSLEWSLYPIAVSGEKNRNNYQPVLLDGAEAQRVVSRVEAMSDIRVEPFAQGAGAAQTPIVYEGGAQ